MTSDHKKRVLDFAQWVQDNPPPDLQALVAKHGSYSQVPKEAWADFDQRMEEWQTRRRNRLGYVEKD